MATARASRGRWKAFSTSSLGEAGRRACAGRCARREAPGERGCESVSQVHRTERASMSTSSTSDPKRELLRHALPTLAYRGGKAIPGPPEGFVAFRVSQAGRPPG